MKIPDSLKRYGLAKVYDYLDKDPMNNMGKVMDLVNKFAGDTLSLQREAFDKVINDKDSCWHQLIEKVWTQTDPSVLKTIFNNFFVNANLVGWPKQEELRKKYGCNIPWAILLDPTSACNLHCTGCWAAEYGNKLNLTFDEIDSIITQGKELGIYLYIYTGGEPLVRKKDLIALCEKHSDAAFLSFTNATLIDEEFCQDMLRVGNFIPAISLEGFEEANDSRRGEGVYDKVTHAMALLKQHHLPFGISACYTSVNYKDITSEKFYDLIMDLGAYFVWFFHYMPVGNDAAPELMPNPEQRAEVYRRIRAMRETKGIFAMDFQNDAEYVGGCIAGGRRYLHINANGDVDPCVFIHYSDSNIREKSLLECLQSPMFMAYHDNQPFNENMLRPCPMLENPEFIEKMVHETGAHSTDPQSPESVEHLTANPLFRLVRHDVTFPYFEEVDQIYNLACPSAPADYMHDPVMTLKTSLIGAVNMLEVARRMGARILQASSGKVYGKAQVPSIPEQYRGNVSPVGERSAYEEGKRAAESIFTAYHHQYGVDIRIPRLFNVYGPRMPLGNGRVISAFIKSALSGESISIRGNGMQTRCFLYIDDAVEALVRMMNSTGKLSEPVNIGGVDPVRIDALAEDVVHLTGSPSRIVLLNLPTDSSQNTVPDIELARRKLDWEPRIPIEEGLTRTLRYFEERMRMENRAYPFMSWVEIM